jgi:hypothetical protein
VRTPATIADDHSGNVIARPGGGTFGAVLDSRIRARYIEPVDLLIAAEDNEPPIQRRFGFTVLALDCLLVETLGAFLGGLERTTGRSEHTFLQIPYYATADVRDFPLVLAKQFYSDFRCGILHQAEIGGDSKVWSIGPIVQNVHGSLIINRNAFHDRLKTEFRTYLEELRNPANVQLRANFRKKMNFIARA